MKKIFNSGKKVSLCIILSLLLPLFSANALTATEIFNKGKSKIESAKTLTADFTMTVGGGSVSGKIYTKGSKFAIITKSLSNWYNGKDLYTYNASQGETTVFNPTASDLAQINPLLYLSTASDYRIVSTNDSNEGAETIMLIPKAKNSSVKSLKIELNTSTYLPKTIKIVTSSGSKVDIKLSNIKLDQSISDSTFEYPKASYPKATINDMR